MTRNYVYETGSMTGILGQLKWESLKKRRKDNRIILLYQGLKGKARIPTDDLTPKNRHGRNQQACLNFFVKKPKIFENVKSEHAAANFQKSRTPCASTIVSKNSQI